MNRINRIIIQLDALIPSGANTNRVLTFAKGFIAQGVKVALLVSVPEPISIDISGLEIIDIYNGTYKRQNKIKQNLLFYRALRKNAKEGDAVIFCGAPLYGFLLGEKYLKIAEETEIPLHGNTRNVFLRFLSRVRNLSLFKFDGLFVISQGLRDYYTDKGFASDRIHIANMIVDATRFESMSATNQEEDYIAYCGSISNRKDGVDTLIKAFAIVHKKLPNVKLYMAGNFATEEDEQIDLGLISSLNLVDVVKFLGKVSACDMPRFLKNAKVLALTRPDNKQAKYGFPTKLGEYLLTKNPVVITPVGDIPLFLKDQENCYFVTPGDVNDISNKIIQALTDHAAIQVGENGCKVAKKYFDGNHVASCALEFINNLNQRKS